MSFFKNNFAYKMIFKRRFMFIESYSLNILKPHYFKTNVYNLIS